MRLRLAWSGCAVDVQSDDAGLLEEIERYVDLPAGPETGGAQAVLAAEVTRDSGSDGYRVRSPFGEVSIPSRSDALFLTLEAVAHGFAVSTRRLVVHAGGFVERGGAVIYFGSGWSGKSSLTFAAWRQGIDILGDDRVCLDPVSDRATVFPKCLKLRLAEDAPPAALGDAIAAGEAFAGSLGDDRRLVVSRRVPGFFGYDAEAPVRALLRIERTDGGESRLDDVPVVDVLDDMLAHAAPGRFTPMDLVRLVKAHAPGGRLPLLKVAPGDTDTALGLIRQL